MKSVIKINPAIGDLFKQYRKRKINPSTGKAFTLQTLSAEIAGLIPSSLPDGNGEGLSASAISRLENGSLLPGKSKMRILADFLEIPDHELKPLVDLGAGGGAMFKEGILPDNAPLQKLQNKLQKTPVDWLQLISAANISGSYSQSLEFAEDGLLSVENAKESAQIKSLIRALIQSKKAYAQFRLDTSKLQFLERSSEWAHTADKLFKKLKTQNNWTANYLQIEILRCITTASMETFHFRFALNPEFTQDEMQALQENYTQITETFERFEASLELPAELFPNEEQTKLIDLYLYYLREKDRMYFKWLEVFEMHRFWHTCQEGILEGKEPPAGFDSIAVVAYEKLLRAPKKTQNTLQSFYKSNKGELVFLGDTQLQEHWKHLNQSILNTLEQHDHAEQSVPPVAYQESIMLYPITAARLGAFDRFCDLAYFKLLYMQTTRKTRPTWFYTRAYSYALAYRLSGNDEHLKLSLENWRRYCNTKDGSGQKSDPRVFRQCFGEVALWSTWFPLIHDKKKQETIPHVSWFVELLESVMNSPRNQQRRLKGN